MTPSTNHVCIPKGCTGPNRAFCSPNLRTNLRLKITDDNTVRGGFLRESSPRHDCCQSGSRRGIFTTLNQTLIHVNRQGLAGHLRLSDVPHPCRLCSVMPGQHKS